MTTLTPRILIIGASLLLAGLESLLELRPGIRLVTIRDHQPTALEMDILKPTAIIYDRESKLEINITRYMSAHPEVLMIGLDPSDKKAVVWSGAVHSLASSEEVTELILAKIENS